MIIETVDRPGPSGSLAAALSDLLDSVASERFKTSLLHALCTLSGISLAAVYAYNAHEGSTTLVLGAEEGGCSLLSTNSHAYANRYAVGDPVRRLILNQSNFSRPVSTYVRREELSDIGHMRLLEEADVLDRFACFFPARNGQVLSLHAMRRADHGPLSAREFSELGAFSDIISKLLPHHLYVTRTHPEPIRRGLARIGGHLSAREFEVCALLLSGRSSEEIAAVLGVGLGSVQTYRKRAYLKLDVTDMREIFGRILSLPDAAEYMH